MMVQVGVSIGRRGVEETDEMMVSGMRKVEEVGG